MFAECYRGFSVKNEEFFISNYQIRSVYSYSMDKTLNYYDNLHASSFFTRQNTVILIICFCFLCVSFLPKKNSPYMVFHSAKITLDKKREIQHEIFLLARVFHASSLLSCFISSRIYIRGTYSTFISLINSIQEFCTFSAFECSRMRNFWCLISGQRSSLHKAV